jgi:hypothetical protein
VTKPLLVVLIAVAAAGGACHHSAGPPAPVAPSRCDVGLSIPDGFRVTGSMRDPHPDHVGVRIDLRADDGRELHYFAGIPGEFGEGLPDRGEMTVAGGETGEFFGRETTWVLAWGSGAPCTPFVVLGTGMRRAEFTETLRRAGALP